MTTVGGFLVWFLGSSWASVKIDIFIKLHPFGCGTMIDRVDVYSTESAVRHTVLHIPVCTHACKCDD